MDDTILDNLWAAIGVGTIVGWVPHAVGVLTVIWFTLRIIERLIRIWHFASGKTKELPDDE